MQAELGQLHEQEYQQQMKEQILALRANVGRSSEAECRATTAVSALTASLLTIAVHHAATVPPLELVMSAFLVGIPPVSGASSAPVWGVIPPLPETTYPLAYSCPLSPTRPTVPEPRRFKAQTMLEWTYWK